jgi:hypothetical protein
MKKKTTKLSTVLTVALFLAITQFVSVADAVPSDSNHPSAKATAQCSNITISAENGEWTTILSNTIKCSNKKDLFIDVSIVSQLTTRTRAKSKAGREDTAAAEAGVEVRVVIDEDANNLADPGVIVFAKRKQQLSAIFQGLLTDPEGNVCLSVDPCTGAIVIDANCLQDEEVELILETMTANSFNFIVPDVTTGLHKLEVQVRPSAVTLVGDADAAAIVGPASVTIEEVRCIKNEDIVI